MRYSYSVFVIICIRLHFFQYSCVFSIHKKIWIQAFVLYSNTLLRALYSWILFEYILNTCHIPQRLNKLFFFFCHLCYGPTRLFKPPDALAMHIFGHRQGSATMHQWFAEWSTYVSNRHASPRHRDIEKNFNACIEIFSRCFDAKYHRRYIAEQRRAVDEHSAMYTKDKNVPDTSAKHRRHIGDTSAMLV